MSADPLAAIEAAAAALAGHSDPTVRQVGAWLWTFPAGLLDALGADNGRTIARRDDLLRQTRLPARRLAQQLAHYRGTAWARDRFATSCPYSTGDLRAALWGILKIRDRDIGKRQIERILRRPGASNVAAGRAKRSP